MKKNSKSLVAILLSLFICVVGGGYLTSCSSESDDSGSPEVPENPVNPDNPDNPSVPDDPVVPENPTTDETEKTVVTYKAVEISSSELSAMGKVTMSDKSESTMEAASKTASATATIQTAGEYSIWTGKGSIVTAAKKMSVKFTKDCAVDSIGSSTNMTGSTATAVPVVGANLSSIGGNGLTNYVKVTPPANGNITVKMNYSTNASTKDLETFDGASNWILITDTDGNILAVKDVGDLKVEANQVKNVDVNFGELALSGDVCFGFARGAASGGLLIHSVSFEYVENIAVTGVSIDETSSVLVGATKALTASVVPSNATNKTVTWSSSDEGVATVSSEGVVSGVSAGNADITVKTADGEFTAVCKVTVTADANPITEIALSEDSVSLKDSESPKTVTVTVTKKDSEKDATDSLTVTSSDSNIAEVSFADGVITVTPKSIGTAVITVKANSTVSKTVEVKVEKTPVESVTISGDKTIAVGKTVTLAAAVAPENATNKVVTWVSSDETVATVADGVVTGVAVGSAKITATADGVSSGEYEVNVADTSVFVLSGESATISLGKTSIEANDYLSPVAAGDNYAELTYNSSKQTINEVEDNYPNLALSSNKPRALNVKVKGVAGFTLYVKNSTAGRTFSVKIGEGASETITHPGSQSINGVSTDIIPFTFNTSLTEQVVIQLLGGSGSVYPAYMVLYSTVQTIPAESVTISGAPTAAVLLADGFVQLSATVSPDRATEKTVTWTSSDDAIATVDNTGKVTYVKAGDVTITAKVSETVSATASIKIQEAAVAVTGVTLDKETATIKKAEILTLTATVAPDNASNANVTWSSSKEAVATVANGVVTGVAAGTTTITVTTEDGSKTATCEVTVEAAYVKAGAYNLSTKAVENYTVDGSSSGKWTSQNAGASQTHDNITVTAKVDSSGANLKPESQKSGAITFDLNGTFNLTFTDSNNKGITITPSAGGSVKVGDVDAITTITSTLGNDGNATTVTLTAGSYVIYGADTSGSAKIKTLTFTSAE